jgi:hypothetical protein
LGVVATATAARRGQMADIAVAVAVAEVDTLILRLLL